MKDGFVKVAAATPKIKVADCDHNAHAIIALCHQAEQEGVKVLTFPETCITGYTCADLFLQNTLLKGAETALSAILEATKSMDMVIAVGLPIAAFHKLYNCGVLLNRGEILGVVAKNHLPNYGEFQDVRWFSTVDKPTDFFTLCGQDVNIHNDQLFTCEDLPELVIGLEICEDLWTVSPPSSNLAAAGATLILNLSASNEAVGKADYRRQMVTSHSGRLVCGYVYANAGEGESSTDLVFGAHNMIAENGVLLKETRFQTGLTVSEIDVSKLSYERRRLTTFPQGGTMTQWSFPLEVTETALTRYVSDAPFVPGNVAKKAETCEEILTIAALGLKKRLEHTWAKTAVVGLSGGLDSTLAILITARAMEMLGRPMTDIFAVTMPCFGTTDRTRDNAMELADRLGASMERIDIGKAVYQHFDDIGQDPTCLDVTFENGQARERTQVLMDLANKTGGLVIGTGDLSELALGWATYNGDHMSMYAVNGSIPKTLVRHLVAHVAEQSTDKRLTDVLLDILDTPVSPELLPAINGEISQRTEDLVGPYQLHDFFIYYMVRQGFSPRKIYRLAVYAFAGQYDKDFILKWLHSYYRRFFSQQFKRSCLPDCPKVGSVTFSPRSDWRMPSDAVNALWMEELDELGVRS